MNIAIASDDGTHVAQHFGRTRGFVFLSRDDNYEEQRFIPNTFTRHSQQDATQEGHGAQHHHDHGSEHRHSHTGILQALAGCDIVIAGGMGMRLREDLRNAGIRPVLTERQLIADIVADLRHGTLVHATDRSCGH